MPSFENLPIDVVREIINTSALVHTTRGRINKDNLCKLRLVSRNLNTLVSPILFANVNLAFVDGHKETSPNCMRCREIITALATHSTQAFENTKRLFFCTQKMYWAKEGERREVFEIRNTVVQKTFDAIAALKNLRTVLYLYNPKYDPEPLANEFIRALGVLPSFQNFDLYLFNSPPASFTLQPLSNLTVFKITWRWEEPGHLLPEIASLFARCPNLSEIYLRGMLPSTGKGATLGDIFEKVNKMGIPLKIKSLETYGILISPDDINDLAQHLEHLESLEITQYQREKLLTLGSIYNILQQRNIFLKIISTDTASDPVFLSYLASYSGLTDLIIFTTAEDPRTADQICEVVLPKHRETLENLVFHSRIDGEPLWSTFPTDGQISGLLQCQRLKVLEVAHGSKPNQLEWDGATVFDRWFQVGLQLPNLEHLRMRAQVEQDGDGTALSRMREEVVQRFKERGVKFQFD